MSEDDYTEDVFEIRSRVRMLPAAAGAVGFLVILLVLFSDHSIRDQLSRGTRIGMIAVPVLVAAGIWCGRLVRVRIRHSDLIAEHQAWNVVVRYADIVDMNLVPPYWSRNTMSYSGNDVILLRRRHGLPFVLRDFGDEVADPFNAPQRRWSTWMDHVHPHWRDTPPGER